MVTETGEVYKYNWYINKLGLWRWQWMYAVILSKEKKTPRNPI